MIKTIVLIGYMGSGKSAIGKRLALHKSLSFIDLDEYIESQEKITISKIFQQNGELYFRRKEHFYLEKLLSKKPKAVISLGGGTPCYFSNIDAIVNKKNVISFYLKTSPKFLAKRLFHIKDHRPLISHLQTASELEDFISKHLFERLPYYIKAEYHIKTDTYNIDQLVNQINQLVD